MGQNNQKPFQNKPHRPDSPQTTRHYCEAIFGGQQPLPPLQGENGVTKEKRSNLKNSPVPAISADCPAANCFAWRNLHTCATTLYTWPQSQTV